MLQKDQESLEERIKKLEKEGYIKKYVAVLDNKCIT